MAALGRRNSENACQVSPLLGGAWRMNEGPLLNMSEEQQQHSDRHKPANREISAFDFNAEAISIGPPLGS